jgi:superfamily II DNA or RNA helicase
MEQAKIDYYNSLNRKEKQILQVVAIQAVDISRDEISQILGIDRKDVTQVKKLLESATKHQLLAQRDVWARYYVKIDFMLHVFPELDDSLDFWEKIRQKRNFYFTGESPVEQFRDCLYTLLFRPQEYPEYEKKYLSDLKTDKLKYYALLIRDKNYEKCLPRINGNLIRLSIRYIINDCCHYLEATPDFSSLTAILKPSDNSLEKFIEAEKQTDLFTGHFSKIIEKSSEKAYFIEAMNVLTQGNIEEAYFLFEKGIKKQQTLFKGLPLPAFVYYALGYLVTLMNLDAKIAMPLFRKINLWMDKQYGSVYNNNLLTVFQIVIYNSQNKKEFIQSQLNDLTKRILNDDKNIYSLYSLFSYYMTGRKLSLAYLPPITQLIEKTYKAGYFIWAYEAAYICKEWFDDEKINDLFKKLAKKIHYEPILSRITFQEEWEKSLNILLGLKIKKSQTEKESEENTRIVYYFNSNTFDIQPVLQTRKGNGWSKGRNIAQKTFHGTKVKGMNDVDLRISKTMKIQRDYHGDYYRFSPDVFVELIGYPLVFLDGSNDIPVEFIAAQPVIFVTNTNGKYILASDIMEYSDKIHVEKETNTRYKVYNLTQPQIQILEVVAGQKIIVPESGKEKLIELLGTFSMVGMDVHSDLLASESKYTEVKEIPTDSRIRVQLLPFGNGLKAELFVKPFGVHPPYCKAGKGGKVLISNEKNIQLQVKRDLKQEAENEMLLMNGIQSLESLNINEDLISFDNPLDSLYLLDILAKHSDICIVEWPEGERYKIRGTVGFKNMSLQLKSDLNWFDLEGELKVDENTVLSLQQLLVLSAKSHNRFIELNPGEFLALNNELKKYLDELRLFAAVSKNTIQLNKFASVAMDDFFENIDDLRADKSWRQFRQRVNNSIDKALVPSTLQTELRVYQEEGFRWMARLAEWGGGACLADDMGLGKTIQTLAILLHRAYLGPALVVCPVSVVGNWISEAERFAPTLRFKTLGNSTNNRKEIIDALESGDVLVTSYGLLQAEEKLFNEPTFATAVLDEAHVIKNYATKTSKASMQLKAAFRLALTGTPIQNHLGEIWNLFNFINPGLLGGLQHFTDTFIKPDDEKARKYLKKLLSPFILRRTKTAVLEELPPKTEIVKKIRLSDEEAAFYEALRRQAIDNLSNTNAVNPGAKRIQVLAEIMKLRQASCNPLLIDKNIRIESSKLMTFIEIVNELHENKHRALVFSQFVSHLAIVRETMDKQKIKYQYLDGSSSLSEREKSVKKFQGGEGDLFLISLKAGGLGLNLTAADFVIHLDPWWNPAIEDQASDRTYRIGQTRPVTVYRLVAENTIEEKIIQLHKIKRDLAESLLEGSDVSARLSLNELIALIKEKD